MERMRERPVEPKLEATDLAAPIDPGARIGHVHLKVADLDRALGFYCGVLGFELMQRYGSQAAFISAGGYHHHMYVEYRCCCCYRARRRRRWRRRRRLS